MTMAKKEVIDTNIAEIKKLLTTDKILIGTDKTKKALKRGQVAKVFLCSNVNQETREDIMYYQGLSDVPVVELKEKNDELGVICKKPFSISVLGILKE